MTMKHTRTSSIGEPFGTDGREIGRERKLQLQLDEISTGHDLRQVVVFSRPRAPTGVLSERLWATAEEICERQGLNSIQASTAQTPYNATCPPAASLTGAILNERTGLHGSPRTCPRCGDAMNRLATLCGHCWLSVAPVGAEGVEPTPLLVERPWWKFRIH